MPGDIQDLPLGSLLQIKQDKGVSVQPAGNSLLAKIKKSRNKKKRKKGK